MSDITCSPRCMYYPSEPTEVISESVDKNGIRKRDAIFLCGYDDHRIKSFKACSNYKEVDVFWKSVGLS